MNWRHRRKPVRSTSVSPNKKLKINSTNASNVKNSNTTFKSNLRPYIISLTCFCQAFENLKRRLKSGTISKSDFSNDHDVAILNQEVESMRRCLNCSICGTRYKSVILMKCMHTFCKTCIDNRIETRSRRCPGCGTAFSREEVRPFYLS